MKKSALTAYKDKITNRLELYNNHAVILDPGFEPFVATQFDVFTVDIQKLYDEVRNHKAVETFKSLKRLIASLLLILTIPFALIYLAKIVNIVTAEFDDIFIVGLKEMTYIGILSALILWHDFRTNFDALNTLPRYPEMDDFIAQTIEQNTMQFSSFKLRNPLNYMHPMTKKVLFDSIFSGKDDYECNTVKLLEFIVKHEHVQRVLKRLEIEDAGAVLMSVPISDKSAPTFPFVSLQSFILYAAEQAIVTKSYKIYPEHILLALFNMFPVLKDVLKQYQIDTVTFEKTIEWYIINEQYKGASNMFDLKQPYHLKGGIVDSWVKGFTFFLDKISTNLTDLISERGGLFGIGHTKEINYLMSVLQKQYDANTILVGDIGVGKSSIIYGLAQKIIEGDVPPALRGLFVKSVDINKFLRVGQELGGLHILVEKLSLELKNQVGSILYFDDLEVLMNTGSGQGGAALSYLLPLLIQSPVPIVGTLTYAQYNALEKNYPSILQNFSVIRVDEVSPEDTYSILATKINEYEAKFKIFISFPALGEIIKLCQIYLPSKKFPKKAIDVLEQAVITASRMKEKKLDREVVKATVAEMTKIPTVASTTETAHKLLTMEQKIHERYINQEEAVQAIVESLQRSQTMLRNTQKPIGVFLFLGPSGVGKTELAKITAEEYFGSEYSIIRVDLSQFKTAIDIPAITQMLEKVTVRPYSLLLLDEFEKAPQPILDMFLRLFDEGILVSEKGENLYFNNTIIICTSNVGSELMLDAKPEQYDEARAAMQTLLPNYFRPELVNRFDRTVVFKPLSREHIMQICVLNLNELVKKLLSQGITAEYSEKTVNYLADVGFNPGMGARPLKRAIQDTIEANIARYMLETQHTTGENPTYVNFDTIIDIAEGKTE